MDSAFARPATEFDFVTIGLLILHHDRFNHLTVLVIHLTLSDEVLNLVSIHTSRIEITTRKRILKQGVFVEKTSPFRSEFLGLKIEETLVSDDAIVRNCNR